MSAFGAKGVLLRLRASGLVPRRPLGQHFLHDPGLLAALACDAAIRPDERVFEVGTGPGTLTRELALRAARVLTVEVDAGLLAFAREELSGFSNVSFLHADVLARGGLEPAVAAELHAFEPFVWVSNLPYNIATHLVLEVCESPLRWDRAHLLVQSEVAQRLTAAPGAPEYGPVTALLAYWARERTAGRRVPAGAFWPPPSVDSRVVRLAGRSPLGAAEEYPGYRAWVKRLFTSRRKQIGRLLRDCLGTARAAEALGLGGWDPRSRAGELGPEDFLLLARRFSDGPSNRGLGA